ncbi:hypothetical protein [Sulfurisoma sediminicola]|uniref:Uncharacterized protein n=1 Tax=Sulfurisoma sediminicola TaxID=1381557 RepID=A0A497XCD9_9PROT|nr:hypothetical protein [Sulfurisoma sediminicola]RLJ64590.1 hypothetical protein DFR35_1231 [Sulfurisoma sediminicola]
MTILTVVKKERFSVVPDRILEDRRLSLAARAVAAWLHGRADGFEVRVEAMRTRFLGLSEKSWRAIRKEFELVGWWRSRREKVADGKFTWSHTFCADEEATILPHSMDGGGMDARGQVNHEDVHQEEKAAAELDAAAAETQATVRGWDILHGVKCWRKEPGDKPLVVGLMARHGVEAVEAAAARLAAELGTLPLPSQVEAALAASKAAAACEAKRSAALGRRADAPPPAAAERARAGVAKAKSVLAGRLP